MINKGQREFFLLIYFPNLWGFLVDFIDHSQCIEGTFFFPFFLIFKVTVKPKSRWVFYLCCLKVAVFCKQYGLAHIRDIVTISQLGYRFCMKFNFCSSEARQEVKQCTSENVHFWKVVPLLVTAESSCKNCILQVQCTCWKYWAEFPSKARSLDVHGKCCVCSGA